MAEIVLFHSVLGVREGVEDAANRLRTAGHIVHVPNLYEEGLVFDDYQEADEYLQSIGSYPELLKRTKAAVADLPTGLVYAGFSNGGASAEYLAATRAGAKAALLFSGALPLEMLLGIAGESPRQWPADVPVQLHYGSSDPFRNQDWVESFVQMVRDANGKLSFYEYPGSGHLFTDRSLPNEYDSAATSLLWERSLDFLKSAD